MLNNIWRYSINEGDYGGVVFSETKEGAINKVRQKYKNGDILVWLMTNDDYFDEQHQDVLECYGY